MTDLDTARQWHQRGDLERAIAQYRHALKATPGDLTDWYDYAIALLQSQRAHEAIPALQQALRLAPTHLDVLLTLSQAHQACGETGDALACAQAATTSHPRHPLGWLALGRLETGCGNNAAAETALRRAIALAPNLDEAWHYLGEALQRQHRWHEAMDAYRQAMRSQPGEIMNIGICSEQAGLWDAARDAYQGMCRLYPERRDCLARLAQVCAMLCDFQTQSEAIQRLDTLLTGTGAAAPDDCPEPFALSYLPISDASRRQALQHYARRISRRAGPAMPQRAPSSGHRIKIGYLGADFGAHAVGTLLRGLFAAHDRHRFEVRGYSLKQHHDPTAAAIRAEFDHFRDLDGMPFTEIAACIHRDGVDVLIDLGGYTRDARPEVLALRPAPVQLGWLGFIHGQQAPWLDGLVLDACIQPADAPWPFSDTVLRLPGLLFPCGPMPKGTPDRARFGLPEGVSLLASFNNSYKLDDELVGAWLQILDRAPAAHLAIYLPPQARSYFLHAWVQRGGDASRVHVLDHLPLAEQADRAASCDLFLDAFRYQGGATALACVAAGLPLLTRKGDTSLARLGHGINCFLGMEALSCTDTAHYIEQAVALVQDRTRLAALRESMAHAVADTGLFDPRRAASAIEALIDELTRVPAPTAPAPEP